jgi:hypothetical protein
MMKRIAASLRALPLALMLSAAPAGAQIQQSSVVEDMLKRAQDAYNDLNFQRADTLANQAPAQRRAASLSMLRQLVRLNLDLQVPAELRWAGLDSLIDEAKRTTFGIAVASDSTQAVVGPQGMGKIAVRSNRPGRYRMAIYQGATQAGVAIATDSAPSGTSADLRFPGMRNERPIFATGDYTVVVTGVDANGRDTVTQRLAMRVEAPALEFAPLPSVMDSTKLLPVRSRRYGMKAVFPALVTGGIAFALSSVLRGEGEISRAQDADSKGMAVAGAIVGVTIFAGLTDRGRPLPANVAANKAFGEAFAKSITDAQAENRRRVTEHRTTIRIEGAQ